jgi:hypothetical protein
MLFALIALLQHEAPFSERCCKNSIRAWAIENICHITHRT